MSPLTMSKGLHLKPTDTLFLNVTKGLEELRQFAALNRTHKATLAVRHPVIIHILQCVFSPFEKVDHRVNASRRQGDNDRGESKIILTEDVVKVTIHIMS